MDARAGGAVMGRTRKGWLQTVTAQLRCRRAVPGGAGLENHLSGQYNAFVAQGCAPEEAGAGRWRAWRPVLAGGALDRVQARPLGPFLWWRCCWRVRCCVFWAMPVSAQGDDHLQWRRRVQKPSRHLGGIAMLAAVYFCMDVPCWHAGQRRSISAGGRFGLWFSGGYTLMNGGVFGLFGVILRRHFISA